MNLLLDAARLQLGHGDPHANRRAAWFARGAVEEVISDLLAGKHVDPGPRAGGRTLLSCLEALYRDDDPTIATRAQYAWSRLSDACHQHAYELTPTHGEVSHLVGIVASLAALTGRSV